MRRYLPQLLLAGVITAAFTACESTPEPEDTAPYPRRSSIHGNNETDSLPQASPTPIVENTVPIVPNPVNIEPQITPVPNPTPMATPVAQDYPVATPVDGKPGFVKSPYSETGIVDVRGYAPQTEVRDPYSGKIFLVP